MYNVAEFKIQRNISSYSSAVAMSMYRVQYGVSLKKKNKSTSSQELEHHWESVSREENIKAQCLQEVAQH